MGGQAFSHLDPPINVPRMPPNVYDRMVAQVQPKLERLFSRVTIPREAPGKADHGDIDFLVEGIRNPTASIWSQIESELEAKHYVPRNSHSYAIKHPVVPDAYVQVDVELCPGNDTPDGAELFEWTSFMKSDSDLLQIIGICHRPLGITCNDRGMHVRLKEIEQYNKKLSMLFLTRNPCEALEFYGLDVNKYCEGFQTEEELFDWVCQGRYFSREVLDNRVDKSNDRSRHNKRPMYRRFVEEYMASRPELGTLKDPPTREVVLMEAVTRFNKREEYQAMKLQHDKQEAEKDLWIEIRESLPVEGQSLGMALKALRRWIGFRDGKPYVLQSPILDRHELWVETMAPIQKTGLLAWIGENWQDIKALEKKRAAAAKEAAKNSSESQ